MLLDMRPKVDLVPGAWIEVWVTRDDIENASRGNSEDCAIVRALNRVTGLLWRIQSATSGAYCMESRLRAVLPRVAKDFICDWDDHPHIKFAPFKFQVVLEARKEPAWMKQEGFLPFYGYHDHESFPILQPKLPA
jgi:hypothetical protein